MTEQQLERIGEYVGRHLGQWIAEQKGVSLPLRNVDYEMSMREHMVRVEMELEQTRDQIVRGFGLMEKGFDRMDRRFDSMDSKFDRMDQRFDSVDSKFDRMDQRFAELSRRMSQFMIWSFACTAAAAGVIIAVLKL